ncbi:MAG: GNAT family N-acetyltransferase [Hyphomonadaceae bacterium]|nr:GNAT family N-acetyltransferase [Hyphomonadaceae bacterium]
MNLKSWTRRERPGQWPLPGSRVVLEPLDWSAHLDGLYQAVAAPEAADTWDYMPIGPFRDPAHFHDVFDQVGADLGWETLVIRKVNGGTVLGMASFMRIREPHGSAEVGCVAFGHALRRTPEATEAMFLMAQHLFDELGYRRYEWKCHNDNAASRRAAERFGFQFEGIFRNDMVIDGKNRDTAWFAMTVEDWPAVKAAFEAWLAPTNFDASGQQKQSLEAFRA